MKALVTGGGGFLGGAIVRRLVARGDQVTSLSRGRYAELDRLGVRHLQADLADCAAVREAVRGHDTVFHVAAKAGVWGRREDFWRANVEGTRNLLCASIDAGVARFVFTSSPSVCFDGGDHKGASNDLPRAHRFLAPYPETKAIAEALVLDANGEGGLATCALRPHLIFGPGDPHILPRLVASARAGKLAIVGTGENEVTLTYVENAALAHLAAADALSPDAPHAGKAYFIGQANAVRLWPWINGLLERLGERPVTRKVPVRAAYTAGLLMESVWRGLRLRGEPRMTRFVALQLATSHSYTMTPAQRDFGYEPEVDMDEALERTVDWLRQTTGTR
ncbi:MAG: NAD-dependent epimerase/dehydratase family protein [Planctomycetes bacterium]|nr:NAD-dependent epimerase/dehydratase family protein [Planctomycetota bacterium]MCB9904872.1 NAD-dependent epimerase/dehydratase family protein [Planctomycetota bacterium]